MGTAVLLLVVISTTTWVYFDAKKFGKVGNDGPGSWVAFCLFLWIAAFPIYLYQRSRTTAALRAADAPPPPMQTPAGWYADPEQPGQWRYWDGSRWTEHRAPTGTPAPSG